MAAASVMPYRCVAGLGAFLGRAVWRLLPRERRKTLEHLRLAFGAEKDLGELQGIGRRTFEHYGVLIAEWVKIGHLISHLDEFFVTEGYAHLDAAFAKGRGIVIVAAHFGNWELMAGHASLKGYPCSVVARKIYFDKYNQLLTSMRRRMNLETIYRTENPRRMLEALRQNRMVGFVVDQAIVGVEAVQTRFFGHPAWTPVAPVRFAQVSGAPLIPAFIVREGLRHRIIVEPPIALVRSGDRRADLLANTQAWVDVQERFIRRYPHLWVWNHRRWKSISITS